MGGVVKCRLLRVSPYMWGSGLRCCFAGGGCGTRVLLLVKQVKNTLAGFKNWKLLPPVPQSGNDLYRKKNYTQ